MSAGILVTAKKVATTCILQIGQGVIIRWKPWNQRFFIHQEHVIISKKVTALSSIYIFTIILWKFAILSEKLLMYKEMETVVTVLLLSRWVGCKTSGHKSEKKCYMNWPNIKIFTRAFSLKLLNSNKSILAFSGRQDLVPRHTGWIACQWVRWSQTHMNVWLYVYLHLTALPTFHSEPNWTHINPSSSHLTTIISFPSIWDQRPHFQKYTIDGSRMPKNMPSSGKHQSRTASRHFPTNTQLNTTQSLLTIPRHT